MQPQILNVDILNDKEPHILVQKYIYPDRTFQVFRKPSSPDEDFELSPGVEIDRGLFWGVPVYFATSDEDEDEDADEGDDDDLSEVFAVVYRDEENPPVYDSELLANTDPYVNIVYDSDEGCFRGESTFIGYDETDSVAAPTLSEAIAGVVAALNDAIACGDDGSESIRQAEAKAKASNT